ncbi:hypothetical protein CYMTET_53523 [Cymbomonas tetramitiformis]|uniref:SET domain-containing protein n=1 Tax=Cymbomonas tetramitiformis TaxID=36881 RepID=A0AAE0BIJ6_9CHLO|nr:hypothetical protein CYMTET_53523 [Cymbomonas tetramitiformis]
METAPEQGTRLTIRWDLLELVETAELGRHLLSRDTIPRGTSLFTEAPLLVVRPIEELPEDKQLLFEQTAELLDCTTAPLVDLYAYITASEEVRHQVLQEFCTFGDVRVQYAEEDIPNIFLVAERVAAWFAQNMPECQDMNLGELLHAQGVFALNSHNLGERPGSCLYVTGSKLSHACIRPNAVYHFKPAEGLGEHRALVDIPAQTALTSDYMGFLGVCSRRTAVPTQATKLFQCRCEACSGADRMRALPCPSCVPRDLSTGLLVDSQLVDEANLWKSHPFITPDSGGDEPTRSVIWRCNTCEAGFTNQEVHAECRRSDTWQSLFLWERRFELIVHQLLELHPSVDSEGKLHPRLRGLMQRIEDFALVRPLALVLHLDIFAARPSENRAAP